MVVLDEYCRPPGACGGCARRLRFTAYLSRVRSPGAVLRVSMMRAPDALHSLDVFERSGWRCRSSAAEMLRAMPLSSKHGWTPSADEVTVAMILAPGARLGAVFAIDGH